MVVCTGNELQLNAFLIERVLEFLHRTADLRPGVMVQPRKDMRGAGEHRNPIGHECPGHSDRHPEIGSAVVDSGQDVTV